MSCQPPGEALNVGGRELNLVGGDRSLEVFRWPPVAVEASQRALHHPSARQDSEPSRTVRAFVDLQGPPQYRFGFGTGMGAVGEDMTQARKGVADGYEHAKCIVAVLDVGGVDSCDDRQMPGLRSTLKPHQHCPERSLQVARKGSYNPSANTVSADTRTPASNMSVKTKQYGRSPHQPIQMTQIIMILSVTPQHPE